MLTQEFVARMRTPSGTVGFKYKNPRLSAPDGLSILQVVSGSHIFRLDKVGATTLEFVHSSPGTGTRIASLDFASLGGFDAAYISFVWSPKLTRLHLKAGGREMLSALGAEAPYELVLAPDGSVLQIGGAGVSVMAPRISIGGKKMNHASAMHAWKETLEASRILQTGTSSEGYLYEVVQASFLLIALVTGLENYLKSRFFELEREGYETDIRSFFLGLLGKNDATIAEFEELIAATAGDTSAGLQLAAKRCKPNFQDYKQVKRSFSRAYKLDFNSIETSALRSELRKFIGYRHKVVHISPMLGMIEQPDGDREPVFLNSALANRAIEVFNAYVRDFHDQTLQLGCTEAGLNGED